LISKWKYSGWGNTEPLSFASAASKAGPLQIVTHATVNCVHGDFKS
jgi:hypothetical protein